PKVARTEKGTTTARVLVVSPYSPSEYCRPLEACTRVSAPAVLNGASAATTAPASRALEVMSCDLTRCHAVRARSAVHGSVDRDRRGSGHYCRARGPRGDLPDGARGDFPDGPRGDPRDGLLCDPRGGLHGAGVRWARERRPRRRAGCS